MTVAAVVGVLILAGAALVVARRRLLVVTVRGTSMTPTLRPGDRLLARRRAGRGRIERGAIVVVRLDAPDYYVKRVTAVAGDPVPDGIPATTATVPDRTVVLRGDNHHSLDSRVWGCVPVDRVIGVRLREMTR